MAVIHCFMYVLPALVGAYALYKFILYLIGAD